MKFLAPHLLLLIFIVAAVGLARGQDEPRGGSGKTISIPIFISAKSHNPVKQIEINDLEFFEGNNRLDPLSLKPGSAFRSFGILIDLTGSMKGPPKNRISAALAMLSELIERSDPQDQYFIVALRGNEISVSEPTADKTKLMGALAELKSFKPAGNTRLFDAIRVSVQSLISLKSDIKSLLVVSDGADNASEAADFTELADFIRSKNILFYGVNISSSFELSTMLGRKGEIVLENLSEITGGRTFYPSVNDEETQWAQQVAFELKNLYFAEIRLDTSTKSPKRRDVKVRLSKVAKDKLGPVILRARKGFLF